VSRYHWLTGGIDILGAVPNTLQTTTAAIPAGGTVKRFQLRNCYVSMFKAGTDHTVVHNLYMSQQVKFTSGPNNGRIIYQSLKRIPSYSTAMFAAAVPVYEYYAWGADLELGINQRCSYGLETGAAANLAFTCAVHSQPTVYDGTYLGELTYQFAVLYYQ
jgi:hypothetical protein